MYTAISAIRRLMVATLLLLGLAWQLACRADGNLEAPGQQPITTPSFEDFEWEPSRADSIDDELEDDTDNEELGEIYDFEQSHKQITQKLQKTAAWLDSFFGSERVGEFDTASTELRVAWENSFLEYENPNTKLKLRGKLRLPHMKKRLQLVFEGEPDERDPSGLNQENSTSALRYSVDKNTLKSIDFDVGFRGGLSAPRLFTRLRMRKLLLRNETRLHRLTPAITWDSRLGWELYVRHDSEYQPRENIFFRATTQPGWSQDADGYTLEQNFTLFRKLSPHRYIALDWLNGGVVYPDTDLTSRFRLRYRRALRENRLYLELAPGLRFAEDHDFRLQWEGYIMLEVVFSPAKQ